MDGIIPLYKERGMTSFDCVSRLRRILKTKKIGHSGTLDPSVDGVLPIWYPHLFYGDRPVSVKPR